MYRAAHAGVGYLALADQQASVRGKPSAVESRCSWAGIGVRVHRVRILMVWVWHGSTIVEDGASLGNAPPLQDYPFFLWRRMNEKRKEFRPWKVR